MNHLKNQISALSDPFPSLDNLLKKKLVWEAQVQKYSIQFEL